MKKVAVILCLAIYANLSSQSQFLDETYGLQGVTTIDFQGLTWFNSEFDVDKSGNAYLFNNIFDITVDTTVLVPLNRKLDQDGKVVSGFSEKVGNANETFGPKSFGFTWVENDHILKYYSDTLNNDTVNYLSRFDLDFNLEHSYEEDLAIFVFFGLSARPHLDSENRLVVNDFGTFRRYLPDGSIDLGFGNNGELSLNPTMNSTDTLWHLFYGSFLINDNDELIVNGFENIPENETDEPWYDSYIMKVDEDGMPDSQFGTNGRYENEEWDFYESVDILDDDEIFINGITNDTADTLCNPSQRYLMKLDGDGELETSFADSGYFYDYQEECNRQNYNFIKGPNDKFAFLQEVITLDTIYNYSYFLGVMDYDGNLDTSFNQGQLLDLDFIPGTHKWQMDIDADYDVYLFSSENTFVLADTTLENQFHVSKLDGRQVWDILQYDSPFEEDAISLYPNPTISDLVFNYDGPDFGAVTLIIYDMLGRVVLSDDDFELRNGENYYRDLDAILSSGNYYVQLRLPDQKKIFGAPFIFINHR